jgi:iron complex outermembrane receptor protein
MSSNEESLTGRLPQYFLSNLELAKVFDFRPLELSVKAIVNNLFDEEYQTLPSRPMPGINFEIFVGIRPKWGKKR